MLNIPMDPLSTEIYNKPLSIDESGVKKIVKFLKEGARGNFLQKVSSREFIFTAFDFSSSLPFAAYFFLEKLRAAMRVFFMSMAIVIGPTPPGTGVMQEALTDAAS